MYRFSSSDLIRRKEDLVTRREIREIDFKRRICHSQILLIRFKKKIRRKQIKEQWRGVPKCVTEDVYNSISLTLLHGLNAEFGAVIADGLKLADYKYDEYN